MASAPYAEYHERQPSYSHRTPPTDASGSYTSTMPASGGAWIYGPADAARSRSNLFSSGSEVGYQPAGSPYGYSPRSPHSPLRSPYSPRSPYASNAFSSYAPGLPPVQPLNISSPAHSGRDTYASENESDRESIHSEEGEGDYVTNMDVDPHELLVADEENGYGIGSGHKKSRRPFVGGFVTNLKKLPRAVARNMIHDRRPSADAPQQSHYLQQSEDPYTNSIPAIEVAPPYSSPRVPLPTGPVHYVQAMEMPHPPGSEPYLAPVRSHTPLSPPQLPRMSESTPSRLNISRRPATNSHSNSSSSKSQPASRRTQITVRNPDPRSPTSTASSSSSRQPAVIPMPVPLVPQDDNPMDAEDIDTQRSSITQRPSAPTPRRGTSAAAPPATTAAVASPEFHEPPYAPDYSRMETLQQPPEDPPLPTHFAAIGRFLKEINDMPWFGETIAEDFVPAETERAKRRSSGAPKPWYARKQRADLLAGAGTPALGRVTAGGSMSASQNGYRPPLTATYLPPVPPPPAPMYVYSMPGMQQGSTAAQPTPQPAYPLYLLAVPSSTVSSPELFATFPPPPASAHVHSPARTAEGYHGN